MRKRRGINIITNAAIFILLEFAALALLKNTSTLQDIWITRASQKFSASVWGGVENIGSYFSLRKENQKLAEENEKLLQKLRNYQLLIEKDEEIASVVTLPRNDGGQNHNGNANHVIASGQRGNPKDMFSFIPASVVKMGINTAHNFVILNKGYEDGVRVQTGIISNKGVVGIITSVDKNYSYGISFLNSNLKVSCRIGTDQVQALLSWDGSNAKRAILNDIPPHSQINPGDTVKTSGLSTLFPADLPIGVATKSQMVDGTSLQVSVELFQDFNSLRYVTIASHNDIDIISELERQNQ